MKSGHHPLWLAVAGFEPIGRGQGDGVFGQHVGQAGEIFLRVDAKEAAIFDDGVEDGTFSAEFLVAEEQSVFGKYMRNLVLTLCLSEHESGTPIGSTPPPRCTVPPLLATPAIANRKASRW